MTRYNPDVDDPVYGPHHTHGERDRISRDPDECDHGTKEVYLPDEGLWLCEFCGEKYEKFS